MLPGIIPTLEIKVDLIDVKSLCHQDFLGTKINRTRLNEGGVNSFYF